jgi:hypothetical protein
MFPLWDFHYEAYERWSINFFIFNSSDLPSHLPHDDESGVPIYVCGTVGMS